MAFGEKEKIVLLKNMDTQKIIVETKNLTIGYFSKKEKKPICEGIRLHIQQGELIGLIGANGVGKSTLLRTLCKMQPPLEGEIFVDGISLEKYNPKMLSQKISVVLTEKPVSANLTVEELVALGRQPYTNWIGTLLEEDKTKVEQALHATQTVALRNQKTYELSDGQLQSVLIARALAQDTPLILLDEPTTHLDIQNRIRVLMLLKKLVSQEGKTILFSSHEVELALQVCDKIIVLQQKDSFMDTPENLINNGRMNDLFSEEFLRFDTRQKRFLIQM